MKPILAFAASLALLCIHPVAAEDIVPMTIGDLYSHKADLSGKSVTLSGKVVKVNNQVMKRNFLHIQDGSGDAAAGTNDLTVTSQDTASVGDEVTVSGTVAVDQDFGYGYMYPLLLEKATITRKE
jgi:hypothetical protein